MDDLTIPRTVREQNDLDYAALKMTDAASTLRSRARRASPVTSRDLVNGLETYGEDDADPELTAELLVLLTPDVAAELADVLDRGASDCIAIADYNLLRLAALIEEAARR